MELREIFEQEKGYKVSIDADNLSQPNNLYILWLEHKLEKYRDGLYVFIAIVYIKFLIKKVGTYLKSIKRPDVKIKLPKFESRFTALINSNRYKNSPYVIEKVNNHYAIRKKGNSGIYFDLHAHGYTWSNISPYFNDCLGSKYDVVDVFDYLLPVITQITVEERF